MGKTYRVRCRKCGELMEGEPVEARNMKEACEYLQYDIKRHDIVYHGPDGKFPNFKIEKVYK